jgi:transposase-like protein
MKLIDIHKEFSTEDKAFDYLEKMRWPNGVACLACGSVKVSRITRETKSKNQRKRVFQCLEKECKHQFSPTAGTIFHDSHLPLQTWFMAIAIICEAKKSVSACQMQRHLGLGSYRTAWHLCHRIRAAMTQDNLVLSGPAVEADETYVGSRVPRRHIRQPRKAKHVVLGMVERGGGRLKLVPVADAKSKILQPLLEKHISEQVGTIYTDEYPIYIFSLKNKFSGKHKTISHKHTYGIGDTHTNTIENAFSLFKKGLYGSFHRVSKKHLARYCDEFSFRFNRRAEQEKIFEGTAKNLINGKTLTYEKLTASPVSES